MLSIQSVMLVALGFFAAVLLAVLLAPAFRARAVRMTTQRLMASLPVNQAEVQADRDRLRAENAVRVHQLEAALEHERLASARTLIERNKRDARIGDLEQELNEMRLDLEENRNAKIVLERTVADRLPKIEARLGEARGLIEERDSEIVSLKEDAGRRQQALEEATQINAQQRSELERLRLALLNATGEARGEAEDLYTESEHALRAEIERLRAQTREQSALIERLRIRGSKPVLSDPATVKPGALGNGPESTAVGEAQGTPRLSDVERKGDVKLRETLQDQRIEIEQLKAALAAHEATETSSSPSLRDSRIALKARVASLQSKADEQQQLIARLRAEIVQVNERMARLSVRHAEEMRLLRQGARPTEPEETAQRRPLAERITERREPAIAAKTAEQRNLSGIESDSAASAAGLRTSPEQAPLEIEPKATSQGSGHEAVQRPRTSEEKPVPTPLPSTRVAGNAAGSGSATEEEPSAKQRVANERPPPEPMRRRRLLDRISSVDKS